MNVATLPPTLSKKVPKSFSAGKTVLSSASASFSALGPVKNLNSASKPSKPNNFPTTDFNQAGVLKPCKKPRSLFVFLFSSKLSSSSCFELLNLASASFCISVS